MFFVPVSFVATLLLLGLGWRLLRGRDALEPAARVFVWLVAVNALQSVLVGLRWGYGWQAVQPFMAMLAGVIPPLSWLAFRGLGAHGAQGPRRDAVHALPALAIAAQWGLVHVGLRGWGLDFTIILTFAGYGMALLAMARLGPDGLVASRLDGALMSYRSLQITGWALLGSAVSDVLISLDFAWGTGQHAPMLVSGFMTLIVLVLGLAAVRAEGSVVEQGDVLPDAELDVVPTQAPMDKADDPGPESTLTATEQDRHTAAALQALMDAHQLYKDVDLNLTRLARRMGLPARTVSQAVNRVHGMSVSQHVNNYRVAEACRLLLQTELPVTGIVFESGFMTKSNFNREFLRVTGQSPTQWRKAQAR
jgi:AraC-like DNA-binding protein